jgi:lipopolysaccharide assembly protein A
MQLNLVLALVFGIVIAIFAVQNSTPVPISFLWFSVEAVAVSVLVLGCATLGALIMFLFSLGREIRHRVATRSTRRTVQSTEQRVADLEAMVSQLEQEKADLQVQLDEYRAVLAADRHADQVPDQVGDAGRGSADQQHPSPTEQEAPPRQ